MKSKLLHKTGGERTYALVFDKGDEVMSTLIDFAKAHKLAASHLSAIGAFSDVTLGYFDYDKKDYKHMPFREQVEVLSLLGDIALKDDSPQVHVHVVVGRSDGTTLGGHLLEAHVRPTLEVILVESPEHLRKEVDPETGLALIRL